MKSMITQIATNLRSHLLPYGSFLVLPFSAVALLLIASALVTGCSSMSNLPDEDNVKVSREEPGKECEFLGKIEGRSMSKTPKQEEALNDLKAEAANKGANYLVVKQYSANGNSVTGLAYKCP
jgi:hypothetical protein